MNEPFSDMLAVGGKSNSLGRVDEVIDLALQDASRIEELCACMFNEDDWLRMRAADAIEKIRRQQPDLIDLLVLQVATLFKIRRQAC